VPAQFIVQGGTIHNILVIAEKQEFGPCLEGVLREHGYHVTIEDSYVPHAIGRGPIDLIIATNTSLSSHQLHEIIPDFKSQYPNSRIMVLSGCFGEDFVENLKEKGIDEFLELPFDANALLGRVGDLLSGPRS
jgi:DNA-binding NtrC family response regulator